MTPVSRACWLLAFVVAAPAGVARIAIEHWRTATGVAVYFIAAPQLPIVDIRLVFDAGSARDGATPGIARLTGSVLNEGTTKRSAQELHEQLASLGAQLSIHVDRDLTRVGLRSLAARDRLDPGIALLAEVVSEPAFAPEVVARERERQQVRLKDRTQSLGDRLNDAIYAAVYGDQPYATPVDGTTEALARIDAPALRKFHAEHYHRAGAMVAIIGALDRRTAERVATRALAGLARGQARPALPQPVAVPAGTVRLTAESTQTHLALAGPGVRLTDPDYFDLLVANHVIGGGGFVSRLFRELREKRGLTYGASSGFQPLRAGGVFIAQLATRNDQADTALRGMRDELNSFLAQGPTGAEIDQAKRSLSGGFPLRIDSNAKQLEYLTLIGANGLPLDYLDTWVARIQAVTPETARAAFARRIAANRLSTVVVGGAAEP
jgi:zinc protease